MGTRNIRRGSRKKPATPDDKKLDDIKKKSKEIAMTCFIWLLIVANLIFVVSAVFQILSVAGGEQIVPSEVQVIEQKVITPRDNIERDNIKRDNIKIEILNGCGVNRLAVRLRNYLIKNNYDVIDYRDYGRYDIPKTLVIDRKYMDKKSAKKIADVLGVKSQQVFPQLSPQRKLDVSIIIGKDYKELKGFKKIIQ